MRAGAVDHQCQVDISGLPYRKSSIRLPERLKWPKVKLSSVGNRINTLTAKDAKYGFGRLIDRARVESVAVAKHGRPVVVVMAGEEFERLKALEEAILSNIVLRKEG